MHITICVYECDADFFHFCEML